MRRKFLCGLAAMMIGTPFGAALKAQPVPARDLWDFPLGAVLEPAALATEAGTGLWNPASAALPSTIRLRLGLAVLDAGADQSVSGHLIGAAWRRNNGVTLGLSIASAAVAGINRTDVDPTPQGTVPYHTFLVSGTVAREIIPHLTAGVSARWREGRADRIKGRAVAADVGIILDHLPFRDLRIAASTFLWRPGREVEDHPMLLTAIDGTVAKVRDLGDLRLGFEHNVVNRGAHESGPFANARLGVLEVKAAVLQARAFSRTVVRVRSGISLRYARYIVGVGREEGTNSLGPLFQFTLSSTLK